MVKEKSESDVKEETSKTSREIKADLKQQARDYAKKRMMIRRKADRLRADVLWGLVVMTYPGYSFEVGNPTKNTRRRINHGEWHLLNIKERHEVQKQVAFGKCFVSYLLYEEDPSIVKVVK